MHCPGGNAPDPIERVLASSDGISPLKPQHSNPNALANQRWCIDSLTPPTLLIIPRRLTALLESLMLLKNWCSIHARWSKSLQQFKCPYEKILETYRMHLVYCNPQTDCFVASQLFSVARHVGRLKLESKPAQLYIRLSIIPLSKQANHVTSGLIRHYVVAFACLQFIPYRIPESSIHSKSFALCEWQP